MVRRPGHWVCTRLSGFPEGAVSETVIGLVLLAVWFLLCALVGRAASSLHRPPATWFLLAALLSPLAAYALLLLAGDPEAGRAWAEREDRIRRRHPGVKN